MYQKKTPMLNFVVLGTSVFTQACAEGIIRAGHIVSLIISVPKRFLPDNSANIQNYANEAGIEYYETDDINSGNARTKLSRKNPDYIFSSWPKIIGGEVLEIPEYYCIGSHPTQLPKNRGRHPLHWSIVLGENESSLSFFMMDEGIDTGNILHSEKFCIEEDDDINDVNDKVCQAGLKGIAKLCEILKKDPEFSGVVQKHEDANYWRKRTIHDCLIDPRMGIESICRLVRSFTSPYPCAKLLTKNEAFSIEKAEPVEDVSQFGNIDHEIGKILDFSDSRLTLKVCDGIIDLYPKEDLADIKLPKYVHPPSKYISQNNINLD